MHLQTNCSNSSSASPPDVDDGRHSINANLYTANISTLCNNFSQGRKEELPLFKR